MGPELRVHHALGGIAAHVVGAELMCGVTEWARSYVLGSEGAEDLRGPTLSVPPRRPRLQRLDSGTAGYPGLSTAFTECETTLKGPPRNP